MATITLYPAVTTDVYSWRSGGSSGTSAPGTVYFGNYSGWSDSARFAVCYTNVTIPQGAKIDAATLHPKCNNSTSDATVNVLIYARKIADSAIPASAAAADALTLTTASVAWDAIAAWTSGTVYTSPDISAVIQEIVDQPDWQSGNGILIVVHDNASTVNKTRDATGASVTAGPFLSVTHSSAPVGDGEVTFPAATISATGLVGDAAELDFPAMTLSAHGEVAPVATAALTFPALSASAVAGVHGSSALTFPVFTVSSRTGEAIVCTFPVVTITSTVFHAFPGNGVCTLSKFTGTGTAIQGEIGNGASTFPVFTLSSTASFIPEGDGAVTLPTFYLRGTAQSSDRFASTVLRYSRP